MNKEIKWITISAIFICTVLLIITISGVLSFSTANKYEVLNLYGQTVEIYGSGIYQYDSYFKAPILIGSDWIMLLLIVPCIGCYMFKKVKTVAQKTNYFAILGIVLYYAFSVSFGVAYNELHLVYCMLVGGSFFTMITLAIILYEETKQYACDFTLQKKEIVFLVFAGASVLVAWIPDIVQALLNGQTLERIEMYTTEATNILDIGIISPLVYITLYTLLKHKSYFSLALYHMILVTLKIIGIMLPIQTLMQLIAGIYIPLPALITKVVLFVLLAIVAVYFDNCNKKRITRVLVQNDK